MRASPANCPSQKTDPFVTAPSSSTSHLISHEILFEFSINYHQTLFTSLISYSATTLVQDHLLFHLVYSKVRSPHICSYSSTIFSLHCSQRYFFLFLFSFKLWKSLNSHKNKEYNKFPRTHHAASIMINNCPILFPIYPTHCLQCSWIIRSKFQTSQLLRGHLFLDSEYNSKSFTWLVVI